MKTEKDVWSGGGYYVLNRQLAEAGAHVVMAVRNTKAANELIQKWQNEWTGMGLPPNIEVCLNSVLQHHQINNFFFLMNCGVVKPQKNKPTKSNL